MIGQGATGLLLLFVVSFVVVWSLQLAAGGVQARLFQQAVGVVARHGRCAIGRAGSRLGGRAWVALALDDDDLVVAATGMAGRTVFARPAPVPGLVGHHRDEVADGVVPLAPPTLVAAAADAASQLGDPAA